MISTPLQVPTSTFWQIRRSVFRERGRPEAKIEPGKELEAASSMRHEILELGREQLDLIKEKARRIPLNSADIRSLKEMERWLADVEKRETNHKAAANAKTQPARANAAGAGTPTMGPLEKLRRDWNKRERPASDPLPIPEGPTNQGATGNGGEVAGVAEQATDQGEAGRSTPSDETRTSSPARMPA